MFNLRSDVYEKYKRYRSLKMIEYTGIISTLLLKILLHIARNEIY